MMTKAVTIAGAAVLALGLGVLEEGSARAQSADAFYKGREMKMIVSAGQGGGYGTYAHALVPFMEKYLPGKPNIIIQHMQGAGGIVAANHLYNVAPKDGSVFALIHRGAVSTAPLFGAKGVKYEPTKFGWIGSMNNEVSLCVAWHTSKVKKFQDMQTHPLIVGGLGPGSDTDIYPNLINNLFDTKMKLITGYNSGGAINLAMERGEVEGRCGWSWSSIESTRAQWIKEKKVTLLVQLGVQKHPDLPQVPLLGEMANSEEQRDMIELIISPQLMGRPILTTPGVPEDRLAALRAAFDKSMADPEFAALAKKQHLEVDPISGERIEKLINKLYSLPKPLVEKASAAITNTDKLEITKKKPDTMTVKTKIEAVKNGGRELSFKAKGKTQTVTLSGSRSKVTIAGKTGSRDKLKAGMGCEVTYAGDKSEASLIACE
jgi:tripartite-type tricarboxylate transporter receptor subunit TctC